MGRPRPAWLSRGRPVYLRAGPSDFELLRRSVKTAFLLESKEETHLTFCPQGDKRGHSAREAQNLTGGSRRVCLAGPRRPRLPRWRPVSLGGARRPDTAVLRPTPPRCQQGAAAAAPCAGGLASWLFPGAGQGRRRLGWASLQGRAPASCRPAPRSVRLSSRSWTEQGWPGVCVQQEGPLGRRLFTRRPAGRCPTHLRDTQASRPARQRARHAPTGTPAALLTP